MKTDAAIEESTHLLQKILDNARASATLGNFSQAAEYYASLAQIAQCSAATCWAAYASDLQQKYHSKGYPSAAVASFPDAIVVDLEPE